MKSFLAMPFCKYVGTLKVSFILVASLTVISIIGSVSGKSGKVLTSSIDIIILQNVKLLQKLENCSLFI